MLNPDDVADGVVRALHPGYERHPSLGWAAAAHLDAARLDSATRLRVGRWLNYPSSLAELCRIRFSDALSQKPGYFAGKCVFVGGKPNIKNEQEPAELFGTPFRR